MASGEALIWRAGRRFFLVSTLRVGMQLPTLCVALTLFFRFV
jgi:hypothetical protein